MKVIISIYFSKTATMTFHDALWKAACTGIAFNTNAAIMGEQIKPRFVRKDNLLPISSTGSVFMRPLQTQPSMVCREGDPV